MSHFTCLVITNPDSNPEELLEPFSEHIEVPEYKKEDVSEEDKQRFVESYTTEQDKSYLKVTAEEAEANKLLTFDQLYKKKGKDWNNGQWKKDVNGVWGVYSTYNPNSKWDWYQLGGRWTGFFKVKQNEGSFAEHTVGSPGIMTKAPKEGYADQLLKKDIDFEGMRAEAQANAEQDFDTFHAVLNGREFPVWNTIREKYPENIDKARDEYRNLETIKDLSKAGFHWNIEEYNIPKEEYLNKAKNSACTTFAILSDTGWCERGEEDVEIWNEKFNKMLDVLPDDTLLSIYDCHI